MISLCVVLIYLRIPFHFKIEVCLETFWLISQILRVSKQRNGNRSTYTFLLHMTTRAQVPAEHGAHSSVDLTAFEVPAGQALQDTAPAPSCCCPAGHASQMWVAPSSTKAWHPNRNKMANATCNMLLNDAKRCWKKRSSDVKQDVEIMQDAADVAWWNRKGEPVRNEKITGVPAIILIEAMQWQSRSPVVLSQLHPIGLLWLAICHVYPCFNQAPNTFGLFSSVMNGNGKGHVQWFMEPNLNKWKSCSEKRIHGFSNLVEKRFCRHVKLIRLHTSRGKALFLAKLTICSQIACVVHWWYAQLVAFPTKLVGTEADAHKTALWPLYLLCILRIAW